MKKAIYKISIASPLIMILFLPLFYFLSPTANNVLGDGFVTQAYHTQPEIQPTGNSYKADLAVKGVVEGSAGTRLNFTLTFTELGSSSRLGSILVKLPDRYSSEGFRSYRINADDSQASDGKKWEGRIAESQGHYFINLKAKNADDYLGRNESVTIGFSALVPNANRTGAYEFKTRAWTDNSLRDSMRTNPETGHPENLNQMASGYSEPVIYVELPEKTGSNLYVFNNNRAAGIKAQLQAEGTGFQTTVYSTSSSVSFLTRLDLPALHIYTTTYYQPLSSGEMQKTVIAESEMADLLQGYTADWRTYYHRERNPGKSEIYSSLTSMLEDQGELKNINLSGLSESGLKDIAAEAEIAYYKTELAPQTEQVWYAGVSVEPGEKGVLIKTIDSSYGSTDYIFDANNNLWPAGSGYGGPSYGFGFVRDGDGYKIERGRDYPGSYIDIEQIADASRGEVFRYISVSSPYSGSYIRENMNVSGTGKVEEILSTVNIKPGAFLDWPGSASFSDDWDFWFFPNRELESNTMESPILNSTDSGSSNPAQGSSFDNTPGRVVVADQDENAAVSTSTSENEEPSRALSSSEALDARLDGHDHAETDEEYALHYAADIYRDINYSAILLLSIITALILLTVIFLIKAVLNNR